MVGEAKDSTARDRAIRIAKSDPSAALRAARAIGNAWYRAQALAWVARFAKTPDGATALKEARAASQESADPYEIIASSSWWLRAMIDLGDVEQPVRDVEGLLKLATTVEPAASRVEALFLLLQATFDVDAARRSCTGALVAACQNVDSWRAVERLRDAALMLGAQHATEAKRVVDAMPDGRHKQQTERRIAAREFMKPRPFFW